MNQLMLQALREQEVAEQMIICDDLASAREHLLRAHQLFPQNDKIGSMLTLCDTLTAARVELPGCGIDHYWVLQVTPSSSMVDIGCQYQKLVTLLQLIRTQFPCTELALKLLKDALIVLEDHKKRSEFDLKRITSWENYRSFDLQTSIYQSSLNEETNSTSQSSSAYKDSSSQICGKGGKATEMLAKYVSIPEANQVNLHGMDRQQLEICVTEPNWPSAGMKFGWSTLPDVDNYVDTVNLLPALQPTSLEENLCDSSKATQQKKSVQDFYNFDNDRTCQHFHAGQVWFGLSSMGCVLGKDFMPRKYVRINNVTSEKQVYVTFLEPLPVLDHEIEWIIKCKESASNSSYEIYPLKGETWAMYKGWNAKWKMADYRSYQCQIVQILSDFSEGGDGMTISTLEQVKGCLTFFRARQCDGVDLIHGVSRADKLSFSHRILAFKVPELASMAYQKTLGIWNHLRCPRRVETNSGVSCCVQCISM
ncbi:hypothetical protein GH714_025037 [Hevea brasiliensis]|uniref:DUF3444 domain-containing protein n=1 Tax=Hevea brasiliensis TaxID=3981 RepID=A0A6A6MFA8_HEVBR|nr:hypothetical protein GH714_025037 [Hevea brasiliensis]